MVEKKVEQGRNSSGLDGKHHQEIWHNYCPARCQFRGGKRRSQGFTG